MIAIHPLAALIPEMSADQYTELREDIRSHGLMESIVLHEHMVLDGRHRLRACDETGVEPRFEDFNGPSPVEFVVSKNLKRRHLTTSQLATIAAKFLPALEVEAKSRQQAAGGDRKSAEYRSVSDDTERSSSGKQSRAIEQAGALVGVSGVSVARAKRVQDQDPEMFEQVKAGELTVNAADVVLRERSREARKTDPAVPLSNREEQRSNAHRRKVIDLVSTLTGFARGLEYIDVNRARAVMDEAELREWDRSLGDSLSKLRGFRTELKEGRNHA